MVNCISSGNLNKSLVIRFYVLFPARKRTKNSELEAAACLKLSNKKTVTDFCECCSAKICVTRFRWNLTSKTLGRRASNKNLL